MKGNIVTRAHNIYTSYTLLTDMISFETEVFLAL
jgi:hypothetical protein